MIITALNAKLGSILSYLIQNCSLSKFRLLCFTKCVSFVLSAMQDLFVTSISENYDPCCRNKKKNGKFALPDKVAVVCCGVEGIYFPSLHL